MVGHNGPMKESKKMESNYNLHTHTLEKMEHAHSTQTKKSSNLKAITMLPLIQFPKCKLPYNINLYQFVLKLIQQNSKVTQVESSTALPVEPT